MREIRFRGKALYDKQWVYGLLRRRLSIDHGIIEAESGLGHDIDLETVGEFTGLRDSNGKEIYEGDVVKTKSGHYLICQFNQAKAKFEWDNPKYVGIGESLKVEPFEIVGNIYDNPELLK